MAIDLIGEIGFVKRENAVCSFELSCLEILKSRVV
jgi:hypothetical protein